MRPTDLSLLEQMRITEFSISARKELFDFTDRDAECMKAFKPVIDGVVDDLVSIFYGMQTTVPEISLLIGDSDTLARLKAAQKKYILDLFSGHYDIEYVNHRLRIGMVHKRIGVEPKLYLAAVESLKGLLLRVIKDRASDEEQKDNLISALRRLLMFDVSLVFDTYIRSMISEIEASKQKSESYAASLEAKVKERTKQLEILSRTDALTGLLNVRYFEEVLIQMLRAAQRRDEPLVLAYIDVNDFKAINDTEGHQRGDEILRIVATSLKEASRVDDHCFRYGGDEFCVVMSNCTQNSANAWKTRLLQIMQMHENVPSLSIGIVQTGPTQYDSPQALIEKADKHMYEVKREMKAVKAAQSNSVGGAAD